MKTVTPTCGRSVYKACCQKDQHSHTEEANNYEILCRRSSVLWYTFSISRLLSGKYRAKLRPRDHVHIYLWKTTPHIGLQDNHLRPELHSARYTSGSLYG